MAPSRSPTPAEPAVEPDATQPAQPSQDAATATEPLPVEGVAADATASGGGFAAATLDELRRVVWPSRQQLFSESVAVILMVGLSAAAIAAIDRFFGWVASQLFR